MALLHRVVRAHLDRRRVGIVRTVRGHVLGHVHHHRAGPAGGGDVKGLAQGQRQIGHILDQEVVLHARPRDADCVGLLEGIVADQVGRHLAGDDHHRDRVHISGGDAGDGIGRARAGGDQHHARLAGCAGIAVGGMGGCLLVPHQDVLDLLLAVERVVDVQHRAARVAEYMAHALIAQETDDDFGAGEFHLPSAGVCWIKGFYGRRARKKRSARIADLTQPSAPRRCVVGCARPLLESVFRAAAVVGRLGSFGCALLARGATRVRGNSLITRHQESRWLTASRSKSKGRHTNSRS